MEMKAKLPLFPYFENLLSLQYSELSSFSVIFRWFLRFPSHFCIEYLLTDYGEYFFVSGVNVPKNTQKPI